MDQRRLLTGLAAVVLLLLVTAGVYFLTRGTPPETGAVQIPTIKGPDGKEYVLLARGPHQPVYDDKGALVNKKQEQTVFLDEKNDPLSCELIGLAKGEEKSVTLPLKKGTVEKPAADEAAQDAAVPVQSLSVQSTSLDDVFVHYAGRALRDALQDADPRDRMVRR